MSDTIDTQRGQALNLRITWFQAEADGNPVDLTGVTVTVREANKPALSAASVAVIDAETGVVSLTLSETQADKLGYGKTNWFRLEAQWPDGMNRVTPMIWVNVQ